MSDLRAAVVNLPRQNYDNRYVDIGDVLDLIPEGAVLVTEETLAAAIAREVHVDETHGFPPGFGPAKLAAALLKVLKEEK